MNLQQIMILHAGGPGSGRHKTGRKNRDTSDRAKRALASYVPSDVDTQRKAEANEAKLVKALCCTAAQSGDNLPFDVIIPDKRIGIEVKTKLVGSKNTITMHPESLQRKLDAQKTMKLAKVFTVIFDDRVNRIYYAAQLGSFKWKNMDVSDPRYKGALKEVKDVSDLRKAIMGG